MIDFISEGGRVHDSSAPPKSHTQPSVGAATARLGGKHGDGPGDVPVDGQHPWHNDIPLEGSHNAHKTNTKEQFRDGLKGDFQWFEGDIRPEIDHPERLEMRHDKDQEAGDNLTLDEWLQAGKESGRGLKLDLTKLDLEKEPERFQQVLDAIEKSGIPGDRLMFNMGFAGIEKYGKEIWERYPDAILAINPPGGELLDQGQRMTDLAHHLRQQTGNDQGQVSFVLNEANLALGSDGHPRDPAKIEDFVAHLKEQGEVSIWNDPGADYSRQGTPQSREHQLRQWGVDGVVDLRPADKPDPPFWQFWNW